MAYTSTGEGGYGATASLIHADPTHPGAIGIADAALLFTAEFHRAGPDLVLTGQDGRRHVVPGYFSDEKHATLVAPNGASLSADLVELLAGSPAPGQYAQAQPTSPAAAIGRVEKSVGNVTAIRNGAAVALHVGDAVYKSDVIVTGANSSVGIGFPDGTALNLIANTRMALSDYSFDPNGHSNGALFSLIEGTFAFVAGKVAHTGDMKIATPVATMGIRGTTGVVQDLGTITATLGQVTYSFSVVEDYGTSRTGQYELVDQNGNVIATVSQTGYVTLVTPQPGQSPLVSTQPMTAAQVSFEQEIIQQVFQTLNLIGNPNPQSNPGSNGSSTPPNQLHDFPQLLQNNNGTPFNVTVQLPGSGSATGTATFTTGGTNPTATVIWNASSGNWNNATSWNDGIVPRTLETVEIVTPVKVTVSDTAQADGLVVGVGSILNIIAGGDLTVSLALENSGVIQINSSGGDPVLAIDGTVFALDGGEISMMGPTAGNQIIGVAGTGAKLVNVDNLIIGSGTIGQGDGALTLVNGIAATIEATGGTLVLNTGNAINNSGLLEAAAGGTLHIDDTVDNSGFIEAASGGTVQLQGDTVVGGTVLIGGGSLVEIVAGTVTFDGVNVASSGNLQVDPSMTLALEATAISGGTIDDLGAIVAQSGSSIIGGVASLSTDRLVVDAGASLTLSNETLDNNGTITVATGGVLTLSTATIVGGAIADSALIDVTASSTMNGQATLTGGDVAIEGGQTLTLDDVVVQNAAIIAKTAYVFTTLNNPALGSSAPQFGDQVEAINTAGQVLGNFGDAASNSGGFVYGNATYATVADPNAEDGLASSYGFSGTVAKGINATGEVVGFYTGTNGLTETTGIYGFLYNPNAESPYVTLSDPLAPQSTQPVGINDSGVIVGNVYVSTHATEAFIYSGGSFTNLQDPSASANFGTAAVAINNSGEVVGNYYDTADHSHGFIYDAADTNPWIDITVKAPGGKADRTYAEAINNAGQVAGYYLDAAGVAHGFVYSGGTFTTLNDPSAAGGTFAEGLNDAGAVVGYYVNAKGHDQAFLYVDGVYTDLVNPAASGGSEALAINDSDEIAGIYFGANGTHGFLATASTAAGSGSTLLLADGTTVSDSTLSIGANDTLQIEAGALSTSVTLDSVAIGNLGAIDIGTAPAIATLTLDGVTIDGGAINDGTGTTVSNAGSIVISGSSEIENAVLSNGTVTIEANEKLTLDNVTVTGTTFGDQASGAVLSVDAGDTLNLNGAIVDGGTLDIASGAILNLYDSQIVGVTLNDLGTINVSGTSTVDTFASVFGGQTNVASGQTLVLNDALVFGTVTDHGTISVTGNSEIENATINGDGKVTVSGVTLTLDNDTVTGVAITATNATTSIIKVDGGDTLTLSGVTFAGNGPDTVDNAGTIQLDGGLQLGGTATLTLDDAGGFSLNGQSITGTGTGETLENNGNTISGAGSIGDGTDSNLTLDNNAGTIEAVGGELKIETGNAVTNAGTLEANGATLLVTTKIMNSGLIEATGGGTLDLKGGAAGAILWDAAITGVAGTNGILLAGSADTLVVDAEVPMGLTSGTLKLGSFGTGNGVGAVSIDGGIIEGNGVSGETLENVNNTISGYGEIGTGTDKLALSNDSAGTIESNVAADLLTIDVSTLANAGTIEALNGAALIIDDNQPGSENDGTIEALAGSTVTINHDVTYDSVTQTYTAATSTNESAGIIKADGSGTTLTLNSIAGDANYGTEEAVNGGVVDLNIGVNPNYVIGSGGGNYGTMQALSGGTFSFAGDMLNEPANGGQTAGMIIASGADSTVDFSGGASGDTVTNGGVIKADGGGTLDIQSNVNNSGLMEAAGSGSKLVISGTPPFSDQFTADSALNPGWTVVSPNPDSSVHLVPGTGLVINASANNGGSDLFNGSNYNAPVILQPIDPSLNWTVETELNFNPDANYQGAGILLATQTTPFTSAGDFNRIDERAFYPTEGGNIVEGPGGYAAYPDSTIYLEVTKVGDVYTSLYSTDGSTWISLGSETNSTPYTEVGLYTIAYSWPGSGDDSDTATFDFFSSSATPIVTNTGLMEATDGGTLDLQGSVDNSGSNPLGSAPLSGILVDGTSTLRVDSADVQLYGGGDLGLDSGSKVLGNGSAGSPDMLENVDNTIIGAGTVGAGDGLLALQNDAGGTIDATGGTLVLDTGNTIDNAGLLEATDHGTLTIDDGVANAGGTIEATGVGSVVELDGVTISGGTLSTGDATDGNNGTIEVTSGTSVLDGSSATVDVTGYVLVEAPATLQLEGTIDNTGAINVDGQISLGDLLINGTVTLEGAGAVSLDGSQDEITGTSGGTLDNESTIAGAGSIGDGTTDLTLDNEAAGVINATGGALVINTGGNTITNAGVLEATGGSTLTIDSAVDNSGTGSNGILANGGTVEVDAAVTDTGVATISNGGVLEFQSTVASGQTITFADATGTLAIADEADFHATIAGFGANGAGNTVDLTGATYNAPSTEIDVWTQTTTGEDPAGTLAIYNGATLEATLQLAGSYVQSDFALTADGAVLNAGTDVVWSPATGSVGGLDSAGNAVENNAVMANLVDTNATDVTYQWFDNGVAISGAIQASYTPAGGDAGNTLDVVIDFTDHGIAEQTTELAGTVVAAPTVSFGTTTSPATTNEDAALTLNSLDVNFVDAGGDTVTVTLDLAANGDTAHGTLTLGGSPDETSVDGATITNNGTDDVTLSGTMTEVDAALAAAGGVVYTPNAGFTGADTLTFNASDAATGGTFDSNTDTLNITVVPDHWIGASAEAPGGDWSAAADWSFGAAPTSGIDAVIDASGSYIVTITTAETAASLTVNAPGVDVQDGTDAGSGSLTLDGALTIDTGTFSLSSYGSLSGETSIYVGSSVVDEPGHFNATGTVSAPVDNDGGIVEALGSLTLDGAVTGAGTFEVNGNTLDFGNSVAAGIVDFGAGAGTLQLDQPASFGAAISNFGAGDTVDLTSVGYTPGDYTVWTQSSTSNGGSGSLAIYNSSGTLQDTLSLNGIYTQNEFAAASDGSSANGGNPGTDINFNFVSFNNGQINQESSQYDSYTPQIGSAGNTLQLTDDNSTEAASWFANSQVSVSANFTASFDYQATSSNASQPGGLADGFAFILQDSSAGLGALGADGDGLGYGPNTSNPDNGRGGTAISPSVAVELNLYDYGSQIPGTNIAESGSTGSYTATGGVDFWDTGDTIQIVLGYNGGNQTLTETLTDLVTGATYSTSYDNVDLASTLDSNTAYVGFSAGTGGNTSTQIVSNFTLADPTLAVPSTAATTNENTAVVLSGVSVSEIDPGDTVTATLSVADGALSVTAETGVSESGAGTASSPLTLVGTASAIDAALAGLSYTPTTGFTGTDTLTFNASDATVHAAQVTVSVNVALPPPTVSAAVTDSAQTESGTLNVNLLQNASDADPNDVLHVANLVWNGHSAGVMPAGFTLDGNSILVDTNNAAYDDLTPGQTSTAQFSYEVVDQNGSEVAQTATVSINPLFQAATDYGVGSGPKGVTVGDLANNGVQDLVVANSGTDTISVLLGNGDGTFQPQTTYTVGSSAFAAAIADFTGDGNPDLVVANETPLFPNSDGTVSVLFGNGNGTFQSQQSYSVGPNPEAVTVGDFNNDGHPDIVVANANDNYVSVLINNGNGTFADQTNYTVGYAPDAVAVADLNHDGNLDLITSNYGDSDISVLLGNGNGTFQAQQTYSVGGSPHGLAIGDLANNGIQDIVVTSPDTNSVDVLLGTGSSTFGQMFSSAVAYQTGPSGSEPVDVAIADVNGDGIPDLVVENSSGTVAVLLGNGNGTFQTATTYDLGSSSGGRLAVADLTGDGLPDIIVSNYASDSVSVLLHSPNAPIMIDNGATSDISSASASEVTFASGTGTLILDDPSTFTGEVAGISGSNDAIDLRGFGAATTDTFTTSTSYDSATNTTLLTVTDNNSSNTETVTLAGSETTVQWDATNDSSGGASVIDPPTTSSVATTNGDSGTITFADADAPAAQSVSFVPEGANVLGSFSVGPLSESNGTASVAWQFDLGNDQINLAPGQTVTQSYAVSVTDPHDAGLNVQQTVSVSIGGPGDDNFVFAPGIGADTIINFDAQHDTIELDHFANAQTAQQVASLITSDAHGDAVIDLGHNDSITVAGVTASHLQQLVQNGHVLLH